MSDTHRPTPRYQIRPIPGPAETVRAWMIDDTHLDVPVAVRTSRKGALESAARMNAIIRPTVTHEEPDPCSS